MGRSRERLLPTFLGIGAPRSGSTWLHNLLSSHPDIFLPQHRKELHFFDKYFERGLDWYLRFFPSRVESHDYAAIGEITPTYMYCPEALSRIREMGTVEKFVVILRNPVDRAVSHYRWHVRCGYTRDSFAEFSSEWTDTIERGFYLRHLMPYVEAFGRENILILISEEVFQSPRLACDQLAEFLNIDRRGFSEGAGKSRVNDSAIPRYWHAFRMAHAVGRRLRYYDMNWAVHFANKMGVRRLFGKSKETDSPVTPEQRQTLIEQYQPEVDAMEAFLGRRLDVWRPVEPASTQ